MDMKIAGSGSIGPGEYDNVKISGSGKLEGPIRCNSMHCAGAAHCHGLIDSAADVKVSGSIHIEGDLKSAEINISGGAKILGNCFAQEEIKSAGSFHCDGNIKANKLFLDGGSHAANIEAEEVRIAGTIACLGLLNAEKIEIELNGAGSQIGSIGGSIIEIRRKKHAVNIGFRLFKSKNKNAGNLTVKDLVEGDEINIEYVQANAVIGRIVKIGRGCRIKQVQYSESIEIDADAEVSEQIKL